MEILIFIIKLIMLIYLAITGIALLLAICFMVKSMFGGIFKD